MQVAALSDVEAILTAGGVSGLEIIPLAIAGVTLLALLGLKMKRSNQQKRRRAASTGYHNFDVARYGIDTPGRSQIDTTVDQASQPLAPSFVSKKRSNRRQAEAPGAAAPGPSPLESIDRSPPILIRPFDAEEAQRLRPASHSVPPADGRAPSATAASDERVADPPSTSPGAAPGEPTLRASMIPPLVPPPPGPQAHSTSGQSQGERAASRLPPLEQPPPPTPDEPPDR